MARPTWSGHIQISLVSFGVKFFPASNTASQISFHQINRKTGERVRHQKVSAESEQAVESTDIVKGYEYSKGEYVTFEPDEIEQVRIPSRNTMQVQGFVDAASIDAAYFEKPYFVVPENDVQAQTFAVIHKALQQSSKAALGEIAFAGREHLVALVPSADGKEPVLMAYTMRYKAELRSPAEYYSGFTLHTVDSSQLGLAKELIQRNTIPWKPETFTDDYEAALRLMVEQKLEGREVTQEPVLQPASKVVNLMDALKQSLQADATGQSQQKSTGKKPSQRSKSVARTAQAETKPTAQPARARAGSRRKGPMLVKSEAARSKLA